MSFSGPFHYAKYIKNKYIKNNVVVIDDNSNGKITEFNEDRNK